MPNTHKTLVQDSLAWQACLNAVEDAKEIAIDVETSGATFEDGLRPWAGWLVGVGIATRGPGSDDIHSFYVPMKTRRSDYTGLLFGADELLRLCNSAGTDVTWLMHNAKFDLHWLEKATGLTWSPGELRDPMVERYLYIPEGRKDLKTLSDLFYPSRGKPKTFEEIVGKGKSRQFLEDVDVSIIADYCMDDCINTLLIADRTKADIQSYDPSGGLWHLYEHVELPMLRLLADMEQRGAQLNMVAFNELSADLYELQERTEKDLFRFADINWNSNQQVTELLQKLGVRLPNIKTPTGRQKLNREILEMVQNQHPVIELLLQHKDLGKIIGTYIEGFAANMDNSGRLHGNFNQTVARTGRLSSSSPNLQNIPSRPKKNSAVQRAYKALRALFIGTDGGPLMGADLSQIEMRFAAHFSQDPNLLHIYHNDLDLHEYTAMRVTHGDRTLAKNVNFGFLYGQRARGLSNITGLSMREAQHFIANFERQFEELVLWTRRVELHAAANGYVETILGRRRNLPDLRSPDPGRKAAAARRAVNSIIQGSAADYLKVAMLNIEEQLRPIGVHCILQVHDELIWDFATGSPDKHLLDTALKVVKHEMENAIKLTIPVKTEPKIVANWAELK